MGLADLRQYSSSVRIDGRGRFLAVRAELNEETIMSFRNERFNQREKQGQSPIFTNEVLALASGLEAALYSYADDGIVALGVI